MTPTRSLVLAAALLAAPALSIRAAQKPPGEPLVATPAEVQRLVKLVEKDKVAKTRSVAARQLGELKAVEGVPALSRALGDPEESVRANAAAALWNIGAPARSSARPCARRSTTRPRWCG